MALIKSKVAVPRISVNKLAEYLEAIPTRRKKIVEDAKYPSKFKVTRYGDAREGVKNYFQNGYDEDYLLELIEELNEKDFDTPFQENDIRCSIDALEAMLDFDTLLLKDCEFELMEEKPQLLEIGGVQISVNPDLIVRRHMGDGTQTGALKFSIVKSVLSDEGQKIVAVIINEYMKEFYEEDINPRLCLSMDVFKQHLECCPTAHKHRISAIKAACEEISLRWDSL